MIDELKLLIEAIAGLKSQLQASEARCKRLEEELQQERFIDGNTEVRITRAELAKLEDAQDRLTAAEQDRADAERWRAFRAAVIAQDDDFIAAFTAALGDNENPTPAQFDAAIEAARAKKGDGE